LFHTSTSKWTSNPNPLFLDVALIMQKVLITNELMAEVNTAPLSFVNLNEEWYIRTAYSQSVDPNSRYVQFEINNIYPHALLINSSRMPRLGPDRYVGILTLVFV
jgi:hypothetical protein